MCNDIVRYYMMSGIGILSIVDPPPACVHIRPDFCGSGSGLRDSLEGGHILVSQARLSCREERSGQILIIVSCLKISWPVSDKWRCTVAFFGMLLGEHVVEGSPTFSEHVPIYVHTYFIRHSVAEYATQKPDGSFTRLSSCVRVWPARTYLW